MDIAITGSHGLIGAGTQRLARGRRPPGPYRWSAAAADPGPSPWDPTRPDRRRRPRRRGRGGPPRRRGDRDAGPGPTSSKPAHPRQPHAGAPPCWRGPRRARPEATGVLVSGSAIGILRPIAATRCSPSRVRGRRLPRRGLRRTGRRRPPRPRRPGSGWPTSAPASCSSPRAGALAKQLPVSSSAWAPGPGPATSGWLDHAWTTRSRAIRFADRPRRAGSGQPGRARTPVTNAEFTERSAQALHRPTFLPIPRPRAPRLPLGVGDLAESLLLSLGQRVAPDGPGRGTASPFAHPRPGPALRRAATGRAL